MEELKGNAGNEETAEVAVLEGCGSIETDTVAIQRKARVFNNQLATGSTLAYLHVRLQQDK